MFQIIYIGFNVNHLENEKKCKKIKYLNINII